MTGTGRLVRRSQRDRKSQPGRESQLNILENLDEERGVKKRKKQQKKRKLWEEAETSRTSSLLTEGGDQAQNPSPEVRGRKNAKGKKGGGYSVTRSEIQRKMPFSNPWLEKFRIGSGDGGKRGQIVAFSLTGALASSGTSGLFFCP